MDHSVEQCKALIRFISIFETEGFQFSEQSEAIQGKDGFWTPPYTMLSDPALKFVRSCYDNEWIVPDFDWGAFKQTEEAQRLRDDPAVLARADVGQIAALLTIIVRGQRFNDDSLPSAFDSGLLIGILRRLDRLAGERHDG